MMGKVHAGWLVRVMAICIHRIVLSTEAQNVVLKLFQLNQYVNHPLFSLYPEQTPRRRCSWLLMLNGCTTTAGAGAGECNRDADAGDVSNSIFIMHDHHIESVQLLLNICETLYFTAVHCLCVHTRTEEKGGVVVVVVLRDYAEMALFHPNQFWKLNYKLNYSIFFDIFLDTPSTNRILPLVTASSLQITSRGRVAFNIIPVSQLGKYKLEQQTSGNGQTKPQSNHIIMDFLSPEFVQSIGQRTTFSESDIEKVGRERLWFIQVAAAAGFFPFGKWWWKRDSSDVFCRRK